MTQPVPERGGADQPRDPLIPIGLTVLALMLVPILLYSLVPEGPVKAGDLVFSTGRHRVQLSEPGRYLELGYDGVCVIEPREQLMVLRRLPEGSERRLLARPMTPIRRGPPFCPPKAEVLLKPHQANLRIDLWEAIEDSVADALSGWR